MSHNSWRRNAKAARAAALANLGLGLVKMGGPCPWCDVRLSDHCTHSGNFCDGHPRKDCCAKQPRPHYRRHMFG